MAVAYTVASVQAEAEGRNEHDLRFPSSRARGFASPYARGREAQIGPGRLAGTWPLPHDHALDRLGVVGLAPLIAVMSSSRKLVKEEIDRGNLAVPDDYEIGSGVSWRLARAARHPPDPTAIAYLLRRGERLILE